MAAAPATAVVIYILHFYISTFLHLYISTYISTPYILGNSTLDYQLIFDRDEVGVTIAQRQRTRESNDRLSFGW